MKNIVTIASLILVSTQAFGAEPSVARGKEALLTRSFTSSSWSLPSYEHVWKYWQPKLDQPPADYDAAFRDHYGLHPAPYANGRFPMGLREGKSIFGGKGLSIDCLLCHAGSIMGRSYVGLGNTAIDIQALFEDLSKASGMSGKTPFAFGRVRGTTEAGAVAVFLLSYREPDLKVRTKPLDLGMPDEMLEDAPAWWLLKKKNAMYHTGSTPARSVRSIMQFSLNPFNGADFFAKEEATFKDIQAYILSMEPPPYPLAIDKVLAARGHKLFNDTCARCHGTYGDASTYPNKIIPLDVIGTDPQRSQKFPEKAGAYYNETWFAKETGDGYKVVKSAGYVAPPLDGIWATAPYFHNGAVPTLYDVLNSKTRPPHFTRSYRTDLEAYDQVKVGWKVQILEKTPDMPSHELRRLYDTTQPGRSNSGHTFGDRLTDAERRAVIEYLKTL